MWKDLPLFPESASTFASELDYLYFFLVAVSAFFTVGIAVAVLILSIRYRHRRGVPAAHIEGSLKLELLWTFIPLVIVLVMFVWGARVFVIYARTPHDVMDFYVTGKQWMWKIQHPTGHKEINDMHVPAGRTIRLTMTSEDVIHSFFVPAFRTKRDVVPGRITTMWFEATKPGKYHLYCAEYCGTGHSKMVGSVYVMEPVDYERWLAGSTSNEPPEVAGERLFENLRCITCHAGDQPRGPLLTGVWGTEVALRDGGKVVVNEDYVRESMMRPMSKVVAGFEPVMPTYEGQVGEEQVLQIIAYIKSLKSPNGAKP